MANLIDDMLNDSDIRTYEKEDAVVSPLLDMVNLIQDPSTVEFVKAVLYRAPQYFWTAASGTAEHNIPPDEQTGMGTIIHTRRVVRAALLLAQSYGLQEEEDLDIIIAACLLHDLSKCVLTVDQEVHYDPMHPYTVDAFVAWVRREDEKHATDGSSSSLNVDTEVVIQILRCIRTHMGVWSPIPETVPETSVEWIVHHADLVASKIHLILDGEEDVKPWRWQRD